MLQFNVPQFIDIEDKIIGVLTIKQFAFIAAGGLIDVALFKIFFPGIVFWFGALIVTSVAAFLALFKFNGRPVYNSFSIFSGYITADKLFIFKQESQHLDSSIMKQHVAVQAPVKSVTAEDKGSQLRQIAALLDQKSAEESNTLKI